MFEKIGSILVIVTGVLCLIFGIFNMIRDIAHAHFSAIIFLIVAIIGRYLIDVGFKEFKKNE